MYEHFKDPLLPRRALLGRLVRSALLGAGVVGASLLIGMLGYRACEGFSWLDAFLNAAMLLGGMGPVDPVRTTCGKLFAGSYALYCGIAVLAITAIVFAPIVHRFLHRFHLEHGRPD